jgi:thioredoxin-like negative regulator of GroEL
MGVTVRNNSVLKNLLQMDFGEKSVFIKFGTDWCIPCQELDKILTSFPNSMLYHVNLDNDEFDNVMEEYNFTTMPYTIIKYKNDSRNFKGVITEEQINKLIDDMKS